MSTIEGFQPDVTGAAWPIRAIARIASVGRLIYLLPVFMLYSVALLAPLVLTVRRGLSLGWEGWGNLIGDPLLGRALTNTVAYSLLVTVISTVLAYTIAVAVWRSGPVGRVVLTAVVLFGLSTPVLVKVVAWRVIFMDNGLVNSALLSLGLIDGPARWYPGDVAMTFGMVHWVMPFGVFPILAVMLRIDLRLERAAESLGARPWSVFRHVIWPLTIPGVLASFLLVLVLSLGFYVIPALLGGQENIMVSSLVALYGLQLIDFAIASAISLILLVIVVVLTIFYRRIEQSASRL